MNLPSKEIIEKVNNEINELANGIEFSAEIKEGYCSLVPNSTEPISTSVLNIIRKKKLFKSIFIWINENSNNYTIDFSLKY